jgi:lipopolysaccharide transport system ATP-binding protein
VLVSHDVSQVERLCDRALWLKHGTVVAYGEPAVVAGQYTMEMRLKTQELTPERPPQFTPFGTELKVNKNRFGSLEAEITDVRLLPQTRIGSGKPLYVEIDYQAHQPIDSAIFSLTISQENGEVCLDVNTLEMGTPCVRLQERGTIRLVFDRLDLQTGKYFVNVGIHKQNWDYAYDYHWHVYPFTIDADITCRGILRPPMRWEVVPSRVDAIASTLKSFS